MSAPRLRVFSPKNGKIVELWLTREEQSVAARSPRGHKFAIVVGTAGAFSETIIETLGGAMKVKLITTQARKLAEAAVWLQMLHAIAFVGEVGAAGAELADEQRTSGDRVREADDPVVYAPGA